MHKYTRTRPNTICSNSLKQLIGYVQWRRAGGKRTIAPKVLKFKKYSNYLESDKAIFKQNQIFLRSEGHICNCYFIFCNCHNDVFRKTKFFVPRKRLRLEVIITFFRDHHYFWIKIEKSETDPHIKDFFLF